MINIIQAINDPNLFQPFLGNTKTWASWFTALRTIYGLPQRSTKAKQLIHECTGTTPRPAGYSTALFLTGRRSGKSRTAALIGAYEAALAGHQAKLAKGETGIVAICAPTKSQATIVRNYIRAIFETPILSQEVANETREGNFELRDGTLIAILAGDWRSVRGFTLLAAILDEACFFGYSDESKVRSDTELVRALQPSLATVGGKLIAISTPYAEKGWCFNQYKRHYGNATNTLVWNCPSRTMNPTLSQEIVDSALDDDLAAARSEYFAEWRTDVAGYIPRELVEQLVISHRTELLPHGNTRYFAFVDISGGRKDDGTLAIAHRQDRTVILDHIEAHRAPYNPYSVVQLMAETCQRYNIGRVTGDNYSAEFVREAFLSNGVQYTKCKLPKSELYLELLPRLCSGEIELLDNPTLINQLANLERHTRSGGRDKIDHGPNMHDDVANALAGVAHITIKNQGMITAFGELTGPGLDANDPMAARRMWTRGIHPVEGCRIF